MSKDDGIRREVFTQHHTYMTIAEVAKYLNINQDRVVGWIKRGWLVCLELPRGYRVSEEALDMFLRQRPWVGFAEPPTIGLTEPPVEGIPKFPGTLEQLKRNSTRYRKKRPQPQRRRRTSPQ